MKLSIYMVFAVVAAVATAKSCSTPDGPGECLENDFCQVTLVRYSGSCPDSAECSTSDGIGSCSGAGSVCLVNKGSPSNDCVNGV
ncbi:uncharacterized protein LY79DRAFT_572046 [Colletotrichum navitas]|uniref:Uncharacterized protein n=1 Tax=Colletotrichum navitas TaxID=681940 RepID=A0AAD8PLK7_9PEZI|nr:uncharacterized protein LY79DRAFT_572046 [Colletotrichum navitas]KAK1569348.1 hypothetical protein LY79DRAFT_572046 [Colletotrichum navitas]